MQYQVALIQDSSRGEVKTVALEILRGIFFFRSYPFLHYSLFYVSKRKITSNQKQILTAKLTPSPFNSVLTFRYYFRLGVLRFAACIPSAFLLINFTNIDIYKSAFPIFLSYYLQLRFTGGFLFFLQSKSMLRTGSEVFKRDFRKSLRF